MNAPSSAKVLRLGRVILGPALADREYGQIACSPGLALNQRQSATLSAYIFGARRSIANRPELYFAFFPLDARAQPLWALCITEVQAFHERWVVFADAIILTAQDLDDVGWAAHRVVLAWRERPVITSRVVPPYEFNRSLLTADLTKVAPPAGFSVPLRKALSQPAARVGIRVRDDISPNYALASVWDTLPQTLRRQRTFCTKPDLEWTPVNPSAGVFDLVLWPAFAQTPPELSTVIGFSRNGIDVPAEERLPWHEPYDQFYNALARDDAIERHPDAPGEPSPAEPDAAKAFIALLQQYRSPSGDGFEYLKRVSEIYAEQAQRLTDPGQVASLRTAIIAECQALLERSDTLPRITGIERVLCDITPNLGGQDQLFWVDRAISWRIFFGLQARAATLCSCTVLRDSDSDRMRRLIGLLEDFDIPIGPAMEDAARETARHLEDQTGPSVALLKPYASALLTRLGQDSRLGVKSSTFQRLAAAIAKSLGFRVLAHLADKLHEQSFRHHPNSTDPFTRSRLACVVHAIAEPHRNPIAALRDPGQEPQMYYARLSALLACVTGPSQAGSHGRPIQPPPVRRPLAKDRGFLR